MQGIENEMESAEKQAHDEALGLMSISEFLQYLGSMDVELRVREGKLALSAPAGVVTPGLQDILRRRKLELVAELTSREALEERVAPLTYAQQRLWLIHRFDPESAVYTIPQAWQVKGVVREDAFRQALAKLSERHAALRTRIELRAGEPVQVVMRRAEIPCLAVDLTALADGEEDRQIEKALQRMGREAFALDYAPLIRFQLFHLSRQRSLVAYDVHHIVADQRSLDLLRRDLEAFYLEAAGAVASTLQPIRLTYAEVAERERSVGMQRIHEEQLEYWKERLLDVPALLELPFAKTVAGGQSHAGETVRIAIAESLTGGLRALAAKAKTSLYMVSLSAFFALLYRYTNQSDFCIGTPLTGRKLREEEELIGLFINMLPIRGRVLGNESFAQFVQRFASEVISDFEHGDVPFQRLVAELQPHRALARSPFFQLMFALTPLYAGNADDLQETFLGVSKFDLTLQIVERSHEMDLYLEYSTDLYLRDDIESFGKHYAALLEEIVVAPDVEIDRLPLVTAEDRQLWGKSNRAELFFDRSATLTELFLKQAEATPDAVALRWKNAVISYRQLQERASRLAGVLRGLDVAPEQFVALCLSRTPALIVTMLAIHQAGAAYLPLDPKYPVERLKYMLEDSGARLLVTERGDLSETLSRHCPDIQLLFEDQAVDGVASTEVGSAKPENAAYMIYTSGSTGKPKGVVVEHRNAVALMAWGREYLAENAYDGMLASTSVCFDLSVFEIFLPLVTGKTIVLMDDVLELNNSSLSDSVTLVNTVPSAMNAVLQAGLPKSVTTVCLAGEFLSTELVDRIYAAGVSEVFDLYGPTETTTYSTCVLRRPGEAANLGGPIRNTRIYLLDERMRPVPPGVPGEIYIGGDGVTRGYLGRDELTAERFVCLPELDERQRLYRTGDLARWRHDGALVFIGRRDHQVKLRGYRIELGEVEAALREASSVTEVAVVVREGGEVLAAYVEVDAATNAIASRWMERMREQLPAYMLPSTITGLISLPRTPNGKIDRQALRTYLDPSEIEVEDEDENPRDLLEEQLAEIWARRLGLQRVSRHAHFFEELGGHSLAAFEIFAEMESKLGMAMMLATLFQAPTVAQLAAVIRRKGWHEAGGNN